MRSLAIGALLGLAVILVIAAGNPLSKWVGQFFGDGFNLTNIPGSAIIGGVGSANVAASNNIRVDLISGTNYISATTATNEVTAIASGLIVPATETIPGTQSTNDFTMAERTVENRGNFWRVPWLGFESFYFKPPGTVSAADLLTVAQIYNTNGLVPLGWGEYFSISDGWQGGRDTNGNIFANTNLFPGGISNLIYQLHTNGMKVFIYTEPHPLTSAGYQGTQPQFIWQDCSNFVSWGIDGVRMDYPEQNFTAGHNKRQAYYAGQFSAAMDFYTGHPCPIYSAGWQYGGGEPILGPGSVNAWQISDYGDMRVDSTSMGSFWTNVLAHFYGELAVESQGGPGHLQCIDWIALWGGYGPVSIWAAWPSPIMAAYAYYPGQGMPYNNPSAFSIETNALWLSVIKDPACLPGHAVWTNSSGALVVRTLSGSNRRYVVLVNNSTNSNTSFGFNASDLGFSPGAQFTLRDIWYFTNGFNLTTNYASVPTNSCLAWIAEASGPFTEMGPLQVTSQGPNTFGNQPFTISSSNGVAALRIGIPATLPTTMGISLYASVAFDFSSCNLLGNSNQTRLQVPDPTGKIYLGSSSQFFSVLQANGGYGALELGLGIPPASTNITQIDTPGLANAFNVDTNGHSYAHDLTIAGGQTNLALAPNAVTGTDGKNAATSLSLNGLTLSNNILGIANPLSIGNLSVNQLNVQNATGNGVGLTNLQASGIVGRIDNTNLPSPINISTLTAATAYLTNVTVTTQLSLLTNYTPSVWSPVVGSVFFVASNNAIYSVSTTKTNLIASP